MPYAKKQCIACDAFFEPTSGRQIVCTILECQIWWAQQPRPGESPEQTAKKSAGRVAQTKSKVLHPPDKDKVAENGRRWRKENPEKAAESDRASKAKRRENDLDGVRRSEREKRRNWRANNPERNLELGRESNRRHYAKFPDESKMLAAKWRSENPERHRENVKRWRLANMDKARASWALRRARQKNANIVEVVNRQIVADRDNWICYLCDGFIDPNATYWLDESHTTTNPWYLNIDHVIPLDRGGDHSYANSRATHALCNNKKNNKTPEEFLAWLDVLRSFEN